MKGLFLICSLISLVGFTNSLADKGQLAKVKETHQQLKENLEKVKNERRLKIDSSLELLNDYINIVDPWTAHMKKNAEESDEDFLPLELLMKNMKDSWVKMKSVIDKKNDDLGIEIDKLEKELKESETKIKCLEAGPCRGH